jgi:hypothetical protein
MTNGFAIRLGQWGPAVTQFVTAGNHQRLGGADARYLGNLLEQEIGQVAQVAAEDFYDQVKGPPAS